MTTSKARSLRAVLAAFLIALGAPGAEAGGPRAPEPGKGTKNGGRSEPGKSVPGGRPRDGSGALPGQPGGARAGGRTEDLSRAPRTEPAARGGEAHAP